MEFPGRFAEKAADSDYSRYPQLQGLSKEDIYATAEALRIQGLRLGIHVSELEPDEPFVITALLAQKQRWDDEGELVSAEFEEYWDATDEHHFPTSLLEEMKRELSRNFLDGKKEEGFVVVNNQDGIWLFDKDILTGVLS